MKAKAEEKQISVQAPIPESKWKLLRAQADARGMKFKLFIRDLLTKQADSKV